jgi:hypothetical protein
MGVADALDRADGVYFCIKDRNSVFLWVSQNFADLVGQSKQSLIGSVDSRPAHVAHDREVIAGGRPLLNFRETIDVPTADGQSESLEILTQNGLVRALGGTEIIGITVCFAERWPDAEDEAGGLIEKLMLTPTGIGGTQGP